MVMFEYGGYEPVTFTAAPLRNVLPAMSTTIGTFVGKVAAEGPFTTMTPWETTVPLEKRINTEPIEAVPLGMFPPESVSRVLVGTVQPSAVFSEMASGATINSELAVPLQ